MRSSSLVVALVVAVVLLAEASLASRVILRNNCGGDIQAVWTGNGQGTPLPRPFSMMVMKRTKSITDSYSPAAPRVVCNLGRGQGCQVSESGGT
jgi:hypothetical protein